VVAMIAVSSVVTVSSVVAMVSVVAALVSVMASLMTVVTTGMSVIAVAWILYCRTFRLLASVWEKSCVKVDEFNVIVIISFLSGNYLS